MLKASMAHCDCTLLSFFASIYLHLWLFLHLADVVVPEEDDSIARI